MFVKTEFGSQCLSHYAAKVQLEPNCLGAETWYVNEVSDGVYQLQATEGESDSYLGWDNKSNKAILVKDKSSANTHFMVMRNFVPSFAEFKPNGGLHV